MFRPAFIGTLLILVLMTAASAYAGDPTRPAYLNFSPASPVRAPKRLKPLLPLQLAAIFFSQQRKLAIINNKILRVGESVAGAKLIDITRSQVVVVRRGKKHILRVNNAPTIKTYTSPTSDRATDSTQDKTDAKSGKPASNKDTSRGAP